MINLNDLIKKGIEVTPEEFTKYLLDLNKKIGEKSLQYLLKETELKNKTASLTIQKKLELETNNQKAAEWFIKALVNGNIEIFKLQQDLAILEADLKVLENEFKIAIEYIQLHKLEKRKTYKLDADF